ncbi:MAG: glycoside hydrolase family 125 protein [Flavisolibacter sp.]
MLFNKVPFVFKTDFPIVRTPIEKRHFRSEGVEKAIAEFAKKVKDPELVWLFGNCFPNTLDTTVHFETIEGHPDTYVITGDIDAMWLRDSSAQVWPYLNFMKADPSLQALIAGVIYRQTKCVLKDPYANAFYRDETKVSEWKSDFTKMKPGVHERKWEIDSLCYPIRLAYNYWTITGDAKPFDGEWKQAILTVLKVFREQQRKTGDGSYSFQRNARNATDTQPMAGFGYPVSPVGLICSAFRPSDDATLFPFLVPSNFFAVVSLRQASEMVKQIHKDIQLSKDLLSLASEVEEALQKHAIVSHPKYGKVYAYEINGFGGVNLMDDSNVPSLLSLPYLKAIKNNDPVYLNTRKMLLSSDNPFYYKGKVAAGIGGPHAGKDMIWPLSIIIQGLTSNNDREIKRCIDMLKATHAGKGFMHESFHKDDASHFTRSWFAWANTIFGEFLWKVFTEKNYLLASL